MALLTPSTPEDRARPAPRWRWRWLVALAVFVTAPLVLLKSDIVGRLAARALEQALEVATGEEVSIGRIQVGYLPPTVEILGLVMTHPETAETIAVVAGLRAEAGFDGWVPGLQRVSVEGPRVSLHLDEDGLREFRGLPKAPSGAPRPSRFPWKELVIRDGAFRIETPSATIDLQGIAVAPAGADALDLSVGAIRVAAGTIVQEAQAVVVSGVTLTPRQLVIPDLDVHTDAVSVDGALNVEVEGPLSGDLALRVDLGRLTTHDVTQPHTDGVVSVDVGLGGRTDAPTAEGMLAVAGLNIWRAGKVSAANPVPQLVATRIGDTFGPWRLLPDVAPASFGVGELEMDWGLGKIWVNAEIVPSTRELRGDVTAEGIHLARILQSAGVAPTPWVDLTGDVETHVTGTFSPFRLEGPFEVGVEDFYVDKGPIDGDNETILAIGGGSVVGDLTLDLSALVLDGRVVSGASHGHTRASIGFAPYGPLGVDVDFPALDLEVLRPLGDAGLGGTAEVHGWVGGRYDAPMSANATIAVRDAVVLGLPIADELEANLESDLVRIDLREIRARLGETRYQGDFEIAFTDPMAIDTQVYVSAGRIHDLAGIFLDIGPADGAVSGNLVLSGGPYDLAGDVQLTLGEVDLYGERFEGGEAVAWMDDGELTIERFLLTRGPESLLVRGSVTRGFRLNLDVLGDGFVVERLDHLADLGLPLEGRLAVDMQVGGTLFSPEPRGRLASTRTYYDRRRLADSTVEFRTRDGILAWNGNILGDAMSMRGTLGFFGDQPYEADAELAGFPLHLFYPRAQDGSDVEARLGGELFLAGRFGDAPTPVQVEGRFDEVYAQWSGHTLSAPEPWVFAVHGNSVQVPRLSLVGGATRLWFEGYTTAQGRLAFRGGGDADLDLARAFVPELQVAEGVAKLDVGLEQDAAGDPRLRLKARFDDATLRTGYFPADFEDMSATVEATSEGYAISDVAAAVGGGHFESARSRIDAEGWWPNRFALEGTLTDAQVQYLDYLPPMVGDAALRFDGPTSDLLLSGTINIDEMEFSDRVDWEAMVLSIRQERITGSAPVEGEAYFAMDLQVSADDTIRLRNNIAQADASAELRIIGDTGRPGMVGEIELEPGGQVYLHEREFEIGRGEIRYVDPYTFDPDLDIQLQTEVRSKEQDYRVTYGVSGLFSDWRTTTSSDPYLAQADVNALLLLGVTREELERTGAINVASALVAETSDLILAQTVISRANLFIIDRWSLVSGVSERGSSTVTSDVRLLAEKQLGGFDFTVEKNLGSNLGTDWYVSVERRIAERLYATAYVATQQEGRTLGIPAIGAEFKIKWELD